jgi:hypothetical protein
MYPTFPATVHWEIKSTWKHPSTTLITLDEDDLVIYSEIGRLTRIL